MDFELNIDELILTGFSRSNKDIITSAFQTELVRLFAENGIPQQFKNNVEMSQMDGGTFSFRKDSSVEGIGVQAANSVFKLLRQ